MLGRRPSGRNSTETRVPPLSPGARLEPGDVVVLALGSPGFVERSADEYSRGLVGVVSLKPGFVTGNSFDAEDGADTALAAERLRATRAGDHARAREVSTQLVALKAERQRPVALLGRVPVKVDGAYGAIHPGDVLTSSPTPGHAMALAQPGPSLGIALEGWSSSDRGSILAFIDPGWFGGRTEKAQAPEVRLPEKAPETPAEPNGDAQTSHPFRAAAREVAETFLASSPAGVGDVVAIDPDRDGYVIPAHEAADAAVIGVVTSGPSLLLGSAESDRAVVALVGTTQCKVDARYGAIRPGDLLVTSPTPGHAMRAVDAPPGAVFAKALESLEVGTDTIRVLLWAR